MSDSISRTCHVILFSTSDQSILEVASNHGRVRFTDHYFLGDFRRGWHRSADHRPEGTQPRNCAVRPDSDRGHLLVVLALLLHGSDESPHWSQAAPKHHPDYGT